MKLFFLTLLVFITLGSKEGVKKNEVLANREALKEQNYRFLNNFFQDTVKTKKCWQEIAGGLKKMVFVDITQQRLNVVDFADTFKLILSTKISSGRIKSSTPHGMFEILKKRLARPSKKHGGVMTFWNCLTPDEAIGIHGLRNRSYERNLGRPVSHGCIRISKRIEKYFYTIIPIGTKVLIE